MLVRELEQLAELHSHGVLTDREFQLAKTRMLGTRQVRMKRAPDGRQICGMNETTWLSMMHLSPLAGYLLMPGLGLMIPLVMWLVSREKSPESDRHGRMIANWVITSLILTILAILLVSVGIGIPLLALIVILDVVFPIIGCLKAKKNESWRYPLSIEFFRVDAGTARSLGAVSA